MMDMDIAWMVEIASMTDGPEAEEFLDAAAECHEAEVAVSETAAAASAFPMGHPAFPRLLELNRAAVARLIAAEKAAIAAGDAWIGG